MSSEQLNAAFEKASEAIASLADDVRPPAYRKALLALLAALGTLRDEVLAMQSRERGRGLGETTAPPEDMTSGS